MKRLLTLAIAAAFIAASAGLLARAAANPGLRGIKSKSEIDGLVAGLRAGKLKGPQPLFQEERGTYRVYTSFIDRRKGVADIHVDDDEVFLILSGSARCTLGGDIVNKTRGGDDNDYHGSEIVGGETRTIGAGDVISAPRGTAHQMDPGTGHVLYIVIKIKGKP